MNTKKQNVSKYQKIIAFGLMIGIVLTFAFLKSNQVKKAEEQNKTMIENYENTITSSVKHLYNDDIENSEKNEYINDSTYTSLKDKFKEPNSRLKDTGIHLSDISFEKIRTSSRRQDGQRFYIYVGTLTFTWSFNENNTVANTEKRKATVYMTKDKDNYRLYNIGLETSN